MAISPLPWSCDTGEIYDAEEIGVADTSFCTGSDDNAPFIVRAVNALEANEALIKELVEALKDALGYLEDDGVIGDLPDTMRAALAKAEARS